MLEVAMSDLWAVEGEEEGHASEQSSSGCRRGQGRALVTLLPSLHNNVAKTTSHRVVLSTSLGTGGRTLSFRKKAFISLEQYVVLVRGKQTDSSFITMSLPQAKQHGADLHIDTFKIHNEPWHLLLLLINAHPPLPSAH